MTLKVKIREDNKVIIKCDSATHSAQEKLWFIGLMRSIRDGDPKTHPAISIKDKAGEIPKLPPPKPSQDGKPINVPQKLTSEMIKKLEIQPLVKGKPIPPEIFEKMKIEKVKVEKKTKVKK